MSMLSGPSRTIQASFPFVFEVLYIDNIHFMVVSLPAGKLSSATKSSNTCDLILPLRTY